MQDPEPTPQPYGAAEADACILAAVKAISDLATKRGIIGLDFADFRVLFEDENAGLALCGHGTAAGSDRAVRAAEAAVADLNDQLAELRAAQAEQPRDAVADLIGSQERETAELLRRMTVRDEKQEEG